MVSPSFFPAFNEQETLPWKIRVWSEIIWFEPWNGWNQKIVTSLDVWLLLTIKTGLNLNNHCGFKGYYLDSNHEHLDLFWVGSNLMIIVFFDNLKRAKWGCPGMLPLFYPAMLISKTSITSNWTINDRSGDTIINLTINNVCCGFIIERPKTRNHIQNKIAGPEINWHRHGKSLWKS